jgi:hypothetical protein
MTNASSMYVSLGLGAIIGAVISWWIYNIQKKTSMKQDETLRRISELEESHDRVLKSIQYFQQHQEKLLNISFWMRKVKVEDHILFLLFGCQRP